MICREMHIEDARTHWLLISQVEHARLSGTLAEHCMPQFGEPLNGDFAKHDLDSLRRELLATIVHHDDGWAEWESQPQLNKERGRPLSFLELELSDSLTIWSDSIRVAQSIGKLAAWAVAGHFQALLEASEESRDTLAGKAWLVETRENRAGWFAAWQAEQPQFHTKRLAEEALLWLQLFDVLSLWLCMACPGGGERVVKWPGNYTCVEGKPLATVIGPSVPEGDENYPASVERSQVTVDPWPFPVPELSVNALGKVVPVQKYRSEEEFEAACSPQQVRWQLVPPRD